MDCINFKWQNSFFSVINVSSSKYISWDMLAYGRFQIQVPYPLHSHCRLRNSWLPVIALHRCQLDPSENYFCSLRKNVKTLVKDITSYLVYLVVHSFEHHHLPRFVNLDRGFLTLIPTSQILLNTYVNKDFSD